jgi:F-type H+-transporting ATPase subunit alpha
LHQLLEEQKPPQLSDPASQLQTILDLVQEVSRKFTSQVHFQDIGTVLHIGDGVASLSGLPRARLEEMLIFPTGVRGLVFSLNRERIDVILLGPDKFIRGGDLVKASGERLRIPVGVSLLGRVITPLGEPLDSDLRPEASDFRFLEREAPGIIDRQPVDQPLHTGLKIIDALLPIGRGQRELIIGNRQTGKTTIATDTIINQRGKDVTCIYVAIGQKKSSTLEVLQRLQESGAMEHTVVVMSSADDQPAVRYLAPYAGCSMAEYFMDQGRDVLIIYDDLTKHADSYRELSLLMRRPPGREAYPGDIFYLHSRLLERACRLREEAGGGSLTALPIVEIQRGNISAFIPTNLISITDGQIVLDTNLFNRGFKPAVDVGVSVSRVGGEAQTNAMRSVASELRLELAQYEEVARFARFGTEVDETTQRRIERGKRLQALFTQLPHLPIPLAEQVVILLAAQQGLIDQVPVDELNSFQDFLLKRTHEDCPEMLDRIERSGEITKDVRECVSEALHNSLDQWLEGRDR